MDGIYNMNEFSMQAEVAVLESLADRSPRHVMEIADAVGRHPISIDRACARLYDAGCIYPLGRGLYEISEEGEQRLETQQKS